MKVERFVEIIGADFYAGVPDSQLKALCDYLMVTYGIDAAHHVVAANEGNCVALAAGYYMATGQIPVVYMQNSGEGNIVNPVASLLNEKVYGIPMVFVIGWRGEPGVHDEPQHIFQGEITLKLLTDLEIDYFVVDAETTEEQLLNAMKGFTATLKEGNSIAFIIRKGAFVYDKKITYENEYHISREEAIEHIVRASQNDPVISTTGKASRELFEIREKNGQEHKFDFLTVGAMGHSSSIALGIALNKEKTRIWCIDGDGAVLMHLGSIAIIGANAPKNMVHVLVNNCAHETVGGIPTVSGKVDFCSIAKACGYPYVVSVSDLAELDNELEKVKTYNCLCFIEVKCKLGARADLGRPTTRAKENKEMFMEYLHLI